MDSKSRLRPIIKLQNYLFLVLGFLSTGGGALDKDPQVLCTEAYISIQDVCNQGGLPSNYYGFVNSLVKNRCEVEKNRSKASLTGKCRIAGTADLFQDKNALKRICEMAQEGCKKRFSTRSESCGKALGNLIEGEDQYYAVGSAGQVQDCVGFLTLASAQVKTYVDGRHSEAIPQVIVPAEPAEIKPGPGAGYYYCVLNMPGNRQTPAQYFKSEADARAAARNGDFNAGADCKTLVKSNDNKNSVQKGALPGVQVLPDPRTFPGASGGVQ